MERSSYDLLVAAAINDAKAQIGEAHNASPQRIDHALTVLAKRVAAISRDYHLLNLMAVDDLAEHLGIEPATVRQLLIRRNRDAPLGRKIGKNTWIVDIDELPMLEQDMRRKDTHHAPHP